MKYFLLLMVAAMLSSCISMTQNRIPTSYNTMSLYHGVYLRSGDPFTGKEYENTDKNQQYFTAGQGYTIQYDDTLIVPLRRNEIIKRIVIMPKKQGDLIRVPRTDIMMVLKRADWME